ncbi:hypothetical protein [Jannaschia seohaensis]|uniref:CHRD domain-containing protein n=1 Tax=Jannaschia seohaensis TaxID=475081 RepID=A0A2Y9ABK7_9RHOB|nr:hypothetical protein [Jannaschia seohaensis]PWJ21155.1 hypothetical protein BCF38_102405 [Jannaschia seohaensis]SSA41565.1 hypothetical protein SAMN05421539_102405 [Jannaschia seohaensis]
MAHLGSSFTSYETFLGRADAVYGVNLMALNNSGVEGTAPVAISFADAVPYLNVSLSAYNLTPNVLHVQHIHRLVDPETGEAIDSTTPTLAADADRDGFVEVLEVAPEYGAGIEGEVNGMQDGFVPILFAAADLSRDDANL